MRITNYMLSLALVAGLSFVISAPVQAATYLDVSATNVKVKGTGCAGSTVTIDYGPDPSAVYSDIEVVAYDPNWNEVASDYFTDVTSASTKVRLCGGADPTGWYYVEVEVTEYDDSFNIVSTTGGSADFKFTREVTPKKRTRMTIDKARVGGKYPVRVTGTLRGDGHVLKEKRIVAQAWIGYWYTVDSARTGRTGRVTGRFKPNPYTWRYRFAGEQRWKPSQRQFMVRRGDARVAVNAIPSPDLVTFD